MYSVARSRLTSTTLFAVLLAGLLVATAACDAEPKTTAPTTIDNAPSNAGTAPVSEGSVTEDPRSYDVTGVVRSITPSGSHLVVEHEAIAGYMHAMTMPFGVSDTASIDDIAIGDRVQFVLTATSDGITIHSISKRP